MSTDIPAEQREALRYGRHSFERVPICPDLRGNVRLLVITRSKVSPAVVGTQHRGQGTAISVFGFRGHTQVSDALLGALQACVDIRGVMKIFGKRNPMVIPSPADQVGACSKWQRSKQGCVAASAVTGCEVWGGECCLS